MKAINQVITTCKRMTLNIMLCRSVLILLALFTMVNLAEAQSGTSGVPCSDSLVIQDAPWLQSVVDSMEAMGCLNGCYTHISIYCTGSDVIYALETGNVCADVPIIFYDDAGNVICQSGAIFGSDCDSSFIPSLNYLDEYWRCSNTPPSCANFSADIVSTAGEAFCLGDTVSLFTETTGGTVPYTYSWGSGETTQTITVILNDPNAVQTLDVVDANGCAYTVTHQFSFENCGTDTTDCDAVCPGVFDPVCVETTGAILTFQNMCFALCAGYDESQIIPCDTTITNCNNFTAILTQSDHQICAGDSVMISIIPQGGTPPYTYSGGDPINSGSGFVIYPTTTSTYTFEVTDAAGCFVVLTTEIFVEQCGTDTTGCDACPAVFDPVCVETTGAILTFQNMCFALCAGYDQSEIVQCNTNTGCSDSLVIQDAPWLQGIVDSMEAMDCLNGCYTNISIYCTGLDVIYALETGDLCADVPTIYYDDAGNVICQAGGLAGSDCEESFISSLNYLDEYWRCSNAPPTCANFTAEIVTTAGEAFCLGDTVILIAETTGGTAPYTYTWGNGEPTQTITVILNDPNAVQTLVVTDDNGCAYTVTHQFSFDNCGTDTTGCDACPTVFEPVCVVSPAGIITFENFCFAQCVGFDQSDLVECDSNQTGCNDTTSCVFPGDANNGLRVNNYDLLNIGFGFGSSGPARAQTSIEPGFYAATDWNSVGINGVNLKHADCNGDGSINSTDILAIEQNYNIEGEFDEPTMTTDPGISIGIEFNIDTVIIGSNTSDTATLVIEADLIVNQQNALVPMQGLAFQINFNDGGVVIAEASVVFDDESWLTANNEAISIQRFIQDANRLDIAISRTDQIPVSGSGRIGRITLAIEDIIIGRIRDESIAIQAEVENVIALGSNEESFSISGEESEIIMSADGVTTGLNDQLLKNIKVYPNPVQNVLQIEAGVMIETVELISLDGRRLILSQTAAPHMDIDLSGLPASQYILRIITDEGVLIRKIIKAK